MNDALNNLSFQGKDTIITCEKCQTTSVLRIRSKSEMFACPKCGRIVVYADKLKYKSINNTINRSSAVFNLGDTGKLDDRTYTIVGIAFKKNARNQYDRWTELVLVDDWGEISFLNCSYGHFTWLKVAHDVDYSSLIGPDESKAIYKDRKYTFFMSYRYKTIYCLGEFPYDVVDVSGIQCTDFISPPYLISSEKKGNRSPEIYFGKHYSKKQIARIFDNEKIKSIETEGVGIAQPVLGGLNIKNFILSMLGLVAFLIVFASIIESARSDREIISFNVEITPTANSEFVTRSFELDKNDFNNYLKFSSTTALNNEWAEVVMTLVNENTGEEREFGIISEYYSGVDNGYSWSEGSERGEGYLSSVPPGRYHIKGTIYSNVTSERMIEIQCRYDSPVSWNMTIIIVPIIVLCIVLAWLKSKYERIRKGEIDSIFDSGNYEE